MYSKMQKCQKAVIYLSGVFMTTLPTGLIIIIEHIF
jgi:hypothetical protein